MLLGSVLRGTASPRRARVRARTGVESLERRTLMSAGELDPNFGTAGVVTADFDSATDAAKAVVVQADKKIVTLGDGGGADKGFALTRHTAAGTPDPGFGANGKVLTMFPGRTVTAAAVAIDGQKRIVVAGFATAGLFDSLPALARYLPDGTPDTSFDGDGRMLITNFGRTVDAVNDVSLVIDGNGVIHVGFTAFDGSYSDMAIAHVSSAGAVTFDYTHVSDRDSSGALAIDATGRIVQAGTYGQTIDEELGIPTGQKLLLTARFAGGAPDSAYGTSGVMKTGSPIDFVRSVFIDGEGDLVLAGATKENTTGKFNLMLGRVAGDGSDHELTNTLLFNPFSSWSLGVQQDGNIVVAGSAGSTGQPRYMLARFNDDFVRDTAFGAADGDADPGSVGVYLHDANSITRGFGVATDSDGGILVAGRLDGDSQDFFLARHDADLAPSSGDVIITANPNASGAPYEVVEGGSLALHGFGSSVTSGGITFNQAQRRVDTSGGGQPRDVTLSWDLNGDGTFGDAVGATPTFTADDRNGDENGIPYTVSLQVTDVATQETEVASTTVLVKNVAPRASIGGATSGFEGQPVTLSAEVSDPGDPVGFIYEWQVSGGAVLQQGPANGATFTFTPADNGTYEVTLNVRDRDNDPAAPQTVNVAVANVAPTAHINGGNVTVNEGAGVSLSATPQDVAADTFNYAWQATRNGVSYASGQEPGFAFVPDDNGVYQVTLTVTDDDGGTVVTAPVVVTALNVAAKAEATGDTIGLRGQQRTLTLAAFDPGPVDRQAKFTYTIDWGDGSPVQTVLPGSGITAVQHVYQQVGTFAAKVTAADKDYVATDPPLFVQTVTMISEGAELENGVLNVSGSTGNDHFRLYRLGGLVAVANITAGGLEYVQTYAQTISRVIVVAQDGNDHIDASAFDVPVEIYGGGGSDRLTGGGDADILVGGPGDDRIAGNGGRDVLIGGRGRDRIAGDAQDDILVGGYTAHDADLATLRLISAEWNSANDFSTRLSNLQGFLRADGADATTFDDGEADALSGDAGRDWFFFNNDRSTGRDRVVDATGLDQLEEVDLELD